MAFSSSNIKTQKKNYAVSILTTTFFLLLATKANSQKTVSFNINNFTSTDSSIVTLQGSATILPNGVLSLTDILQETPNVGRILYSTPVPIWDSTAGNVVNFFTSFSFKVTNWAGTKPADGMIFFLTDPTNINIPDNSDQGLFGVANEKNALNKFVGVEFDNHVNPWDPNYAHIGIDVNSLYSSEYIKWNWVSGSSVKVKIIYDSPSTTLIVIVTDENGQISTLAQILDLKYFLPETVLVGISASSGDRQAHEVYSWSFSSTLSTTPTSSSNNIKNIIASY